MDNYHTDLEYYHTFMEFNHTYMDSYYTDMMCYHIDVGCHHTILRYCLICVKIIHTSPHGLQENEKQRSRYRNKPYYEKYMAMNKNKILIHPNY